VALVVTIATDRALDVVKVAVAPAVDEKRVLGEAEFGAVLFDVFGIVEPPDRVARLWSLACAQHEAFMAREAA